MTHAQAKALFADLRGRMAQLSPSVARVRLRVVARHFTPRPAFRDLGWYEDGTVYVLRRLLALSRGRVAGIMAHELGHAADPNTQAPLAEQRADRLAFLGLGQPVLYDADDVQNLDEGVAPRPPHLHENW